MQRQKLLMTLKCLFYCMQIIVICYLIQGMVYNQLDILPDYCERWRLKVIILRRGGQLSQHDHFFFSDKLVDNENDFNYLGIVFSYSGALGAFITSMFKHLPKNGSFHILHNIFVRPLTKLSTSSLELLF